MHGPGSWKQSWNTKWKKNVLILTLPCWTLASILLKTVLREQGGVCGPKELDKKKTSECSAVQKPWGNNLGSRLSPQTFCNWLTFSSIKTDFVQGQRTLCFVHAVQEMVDQLPLFWGFLRFIIPSTAAGQGIESTQKETICSLELFTIWMA